MIGALVAFGSTFFLVGLLLTLLEAKGYVNAKTQFGNFKGDIGPVLLILGAVLTTIGVLA